MRVAFILASATLAGAFGGAIAYGVGHMNRVHDMSGWRWLFILEGTSDICNAVHHAPRLEPKASKGVEIHGLAD